MGGPSALVLSAGGMFGAYQAGVWHELADVFDPEIVVGASVGALNAWHIACGCSATALAERWLQLEGVSAVRWRVPRRICDGLLNSDALVDEIQRMCAHGRPVRRLGVVMSRLPRLQPTLFRDDEIGWEHLAASCAVPLFLGQHKIGGEWYSDGGLVDPLPLNAAIEMGARTIVTVNLLKHRPRIVRASVAALRWWSGYRERNEPDVGVIDISPDSGLGGVRDSMHWRRDRMEALIERGRLDARARKPEIVQWSRREIPEFGNLPYTSPA